MVLVSREKPVKSTIHQAKLLHIRGSPMLEPTLLSILLGNITQKGDKGVYVHTPAIGSYKGSPTFELRGLQTDTLYLEDENFFRIQEAETKINKELQNV
jgi:hypothetical protein